MSDVTVTMNDAALAELLVSPSGPVGRDIERRGRAVLASAQGLVPVETGELEGSLRLEMEAGPAARISANTRYASYVELGTRYMAPEPYLVPALQAAAD